MQVVQEEILLRVESERSEEADDCVGVGRGEGGDEGEGVGRLRLDGGREEGGVGLRMARGFTVGEEPGGAVLRPEDHLRAGSELSEGGASGTHHRCVAHGRSESYRHPANLGHSRGEIYSDESVSFVGEDREGERGELERLAEDGGGVGVRGGEEGLDEGGRGDTLCTQRGD